MSAPSPDPKRWPAILLLVAVICPPLGAWLATLQGITLPGVTDNPWVASGLFVLYEMALAVISIAAKVWQRLEGTWLDQLSQSVDHFARRLISGYGRHYREYFRYEHRDLDVKGLGTQGTYTLDLDQVFVELRIDATPAHQASANPLRLPSALLEGSHSIWDYLRAQQVQDQHIVVLGAPGNGKTTLLKHLGLCLLHHKQEHRRRLPCTLPVLLFLREHSEKIVDRSTPYGLADALRASTVKWKRVMPPGWIEHHLDRGHCLVLLDGLDEVADAQTRQQVVTWVQEQMTAYHRNRFIVTSRPYGYRTNPLQKVMILEVQPFASTQIDKFVRNWYLANEIKSAVRDDPGVRMKADEAAEELLRRLRETPGLIELAVNPLLLTMIATVHRYRGSLPGTRVMLYKEICEVFLGKRQQARGVPQEMRPEQRQLILQALAYQMMCDGIREVSAAKARAIIHAPLQEVDLSFSPDTFLQRIEEVSGLLLEREQGTYTFAHQTFQEYLTMMHIREQHLDQELVQHVNETWWHEVIRLYCAQSEATPIINACLQRADTSVPALVLALECAGEALRVQPETAKNLQDLLVSGLENPDPERRHVAAEALLARRLKQMVQLKGEIFVDTQLLTCAEYQLFVDDQQARGNWHQPDHWEHASFEKGLAQQPILGMRPSDAQAFCDWLTERESGIWRYRLPRAGEVQPETIRQPTGWQTPIGFWEDEEEMFTWITHPSAYGGKSSQQTDYPLYPLDMNLHHIRQIRNTKKESQVIALTLTRDLDRARDLALTLDYVLARTLTRTLARALARALTCIRVRTSTNTSTSTFDLIRDLSIALAGASVGLMDQVKHARDLDLALAKDLDRVRANNRPLDSTLASTLANTLDRASTLDRTLDRASALALARAVDLSLDLTTALTKMSFITIELARVRNHPYRIDFIVFTQLFVRLSRSLEHFVLLYNMLVSDTLPIHTWKRHSSPSITQEPKNLDLCNEIMRRLDQLERRRRGQEVVFEGLIIVKERKDVSANTDEKR